MKKFLPMSLFIIQIILFTTIWSNVEALNVVSSTAQYTNIHGGGKYGTVGSNRFQKEFNWPPNDNATWLSFKSAVDNLHAGGQGLVAVSYFIDENGENIIMAVF